MSEDNVDAMVRTVRVRKNAVWDALEVISDLPNRGDIERALSRDLVSLTVTLEAETVHDLIGRLMDEFLNHLKDDYEPKPFGLYIETLIDALSVDDLHTD